MVLIRQPFLCLDNTQMQRSESHFRLQGHLPIVSQAGGPYDFLSRSFQ